MLRPRRSGLVAGLTLALAVAPAAAPSATPPVASASAARGLLSDADRSSFRRLDASLPGAQGIAVAPPGRGTPVSRAGSLRTGVAWSTAKVPVAMAAITAGVGHSGDLRQAITASDNQAAERVWSALGPPARAATAATEQVRSAGDGATTIQSRRLRARYTAFGQTTWTLSDQARFAAGLGCTSPGRSVLTLMGRVVAGQRWGLGATGHAARFKGGWGPGISAGRADGWLDRQMGLLSLGGRTIAVAIATTASGHDAGTRTLTKLARWVATHVDPRAVGREPRCG